MRAPSCTISTARRTSSASSITLLFFIRHSSARIGRRLAERFTLDFVDVDQAIVETAGASIPALFEHSGEAGFRSHERKALARVLEGHGQLVSTGGGAVLDPDNRALIARRGFVVYLRVGVAAQLERLARDKGRPLLQRPDREQVLHDLAAQRDPLYRELADLTLDTDPYTAADATAQLVVKLATQWQRQDLTV